MVGVTNQFTVYTPPQTHRLLTWLWQIDCTDLARKTRTFLSLTRSILLHGEESQKVPPLPPSPYSPCHFSWSDEYSTNPDPSPRTDYHYTYNPLIAPSMLCCLRQCLHWITSVTSCKTAVIWNDTTAAIPLTICMVVIFGYRQHMYKYNDTNGTEYM